VNRLDDRDLWAGVVFVAIGAAALVVGTDLTVGSAAEMGEGYVPRAMAVALVALGTLIAALAWRRGPDRLDARLDRVHLRPLFFITAAILAFVATVESFGLVAAIAVSVTAASFAGQPLRMRSLAILICVLVVFVMAVFVWGLGLPLRALPRFGA
jgi:hypothetical protein